jgi:hypothetical protein
MLIRTLKFCSELQLPWCCHIKEMHDCKLPNITCWEMVLLRWQQLQVGRHPVPFAVPFVDRNRVLIAEKKTCKVVHDVLSRCSLFLPSSSSLRNPLIFTLVIWIHFLNEFFWYIVPPSAKISKGVFSFLSYCILKKCSNLSRLHYRFKNYTWTSFRS